MSERLARGDQGEWVEYLQNVLYSKGVDPGSIDGVFGDVLDTKVRQYQADNALTVDGVVDTVTWGSLVDEVQTDVAAEWDVAAESDVATEAETAEPAPVSLDWDQLPFLSALAQYPADEDGMRQFLRDSGIDIDLLTAEA